jgi:hypothetical protein
VLLAVCEVEEWGRGCLRGIGAWVWVVCVGVAGVEGVSTAVEDVDEVAVVVVVEEGGRRFTTTRRTASCCAKWPSTSTMPTGSRPALSCKALYAPLSMYMVPCGARPCRIQK